MKATVIEIFQDKITGAYHKVGSVIDIDDKARLDDLLSRNLVKIDEQEEVVSKPRRTRNK